MDRVWNVLVQDLPALLVFAGLLMSVLVVIRVRSGRAFRRVILVSGIEALLVGWVIGLLLVTVVRSTGDGRQLDLTPIRGIWTYIAEWGSTTVPATQVVGNLLLFVPFGLLTPARWTRLRPAWATLGAAALVALSVEALQFVSARGRVTSTDDVILAVAGAGAGWVTFRVLAALARRAAPALSGG